MARRPLGLLLLLTEVVGLSQDCREIPDQRVLLQTRQERSPGKAIAPLVRGKKDTGIVILADGWFRAKYHPQIEAVQCYAQRQGYDVWLLYGTEFLECERFFKEDDFFFLKHCAVAALLEQRGAEYTVAVIDADVVPVVLDRSLDAWMNGGDLAFYERMEGDEVTAGNYIAKNKPWVRDFLRAWAKMRDRQPSGFSSWDNGALHVVLVETLEVPGKEKVAELYANLTEDVTAEHLDLYWHFVQEAVRALGPPRKWSLDQTSLGRAHHCRGCRLSIWPRMSFFVDDGVYLQRHSSSLGPVMHHGVKTQEDVAAYFAEPGAGDPASCRLRSQVRVDAERLGKVALHVAASYPQWYLQGNCSQCAGHCVANFSCQPLDMDCQKFDQQALLQTRSPGKVLAPDVSGKRGTGIVILADENFRAKFHPQIEAVQCYARRQGYDLWLLNGTEFLECQRFLNSFFFLKHCAVAGLLEQQSPEYSVAVIDGDVVPVVLNRSLDAWMEGGDLAFYERVLGEEVMAGNYIAKNKPWVRKFLRTWANMMDRQPPGFSSADNGALHLVLLEALEVSGKEKVAALYSNLTETVDNLDPYWHFVKEAVRALGPPRKWNLDQTSLGREHHCSGCRLSIWPRMSFFADDGVYLNRQSSSVGPVMHHGIKSHKDVAAYYEDTASCHLRGGVQVQKEQLGQVALSLAESYTDLYLQGDCAQCAGHCVANFTCRPLDMDI
ncbi:unnamed protein product [Effrenium voratum]|nr:unnamed protein product [Effrenium voratum]